jgi:hypothetical protein
MYNIIY